MSGTYEDAKGTGNLTDKYSGSHRLIGLLTKRFLNQLDELLPQERGELSALEVGAGEGVVAARLRESFASVTALDLPSEHLRAEWRNRPQLSFVEADGHALPFADSAIDVVLCIEVLEHVRNPDQVLGELLRVAGKQVIVSVPREPLFRTSNLLAGRHVSRLGNTPGHRNHWSRAAFVRMIARHADVRATASPFPWTIVAASPRGIAG